VLFPGRDKEPPVSKRDLIRYDAMIAPLGLRDLAGRPVTFHRFPGGVHRPGFWRKEVPSHAPQWLSRWRNEMPTRVRLSVTRSLTVSPRWSGWRISAAVELRPWTSKLPDVHQPTWALIDIDPGSRSSFDDVLVLARLYRVALDHLRVEVMPKVTGQRGARAIGRTVPELGSWEWNKDRRNGLARLDYAQNAISTPVCAHVQQQRPASRKNVISGRGRPEIRLAPCGPNNPVLPRSSPTSPPATTTSSPASKHTRHALPPYRFIPPLA
jgi:bifunctional non-homologous end joining protein LigD